MLHLAGDAQRNVDVRRDVHAGDTHVAVLAQPGGTLGERTRAGDLGTQGFGEGVGHREVLFSLEATAARHDAASRSEVGGAGAGSLDVRDGGAHGGTLSGLGGGATLDASAALEDEHGALEGDGLVGQATVAGNLSAGTGH